MLTATAIVDQFKPATPAPNPDAAKAIFDEYERVERANWAKRFEGARSNIPEHFNWIGPRRPNDFATPSQWTTRVKARRDSRVTADARAHLMEINGVPPEDQALWLDDRRVVGIGRF